MRHNVYLPSGADPTDPDTRILVAAAALPPPAAIGGWAAARLHERAAAPPGENSDAMQVFDGLECWPPGQRRFEKVLVCAPRSARLGRAADIRVFRSDFEPWEICDVEGVRITSPLRTAFDLTRLRPYVDGVVGLDRLLGLRLVDPNDLAHLLDQRRGWRGVAMATRVLASADERAESPRETMLRLMWIHSGLGRPLVNPVIRDGDGVFVARVDLLDEKVGLVGEYDGEHHASAARRRSDAVRQEALEALGLIVVRATSADLATEASRKAWQLRLRLARDRAVLRSVAARAWRVAGI